jgi:cytochrome c553
MGKATRATTTSLALLAGALFIRPAYAEFFIDDGSFRNQANFTMLNTPVARPTGEPTKSFARYLSGSSVAAVDRGAMVVDADSGHLVWTDEFGSPIGKLPIGKDAAQLVLDTSTRRVFVADREHDRIAIATYGSGLTLSREIKTHAEPYGVALTPDRKTLLVTTVADRKLSAYDTKTGSEMWSLHIGREPRGVAVSPSGSEAMVSFLSTGAVARIDLEADRKSARFVPLDRRTNSLNVTPAVIQTSSSNGKRTLRNNPLVDAQAGRSFSRSAFAPMFISSSMAIVPHQESTPLMSTTGAEDTGTYGGGSRFQSPIAHRLTFISTGTESFEKLAKAQINLHQPRALAFDRKRDVLYVAGYGSDEIMAVADASRPSIHMQWKARIGNAGEPCGPSGLDVSESGELLAFCSLSRRLARLTPNKKTAPAKVATGPALMPSRFSEAAQRGKALFRMGNNQQLSSNGAMACASCHPEVRTDGLMWRIGGASLNTPMLAGKVMGTHPFKWDGGDKNISTSLRSTVKRLGGTGINKSQAADIAAFLSEMDRPRTPTVTSRKAVARGKKIFRSREAGCTTCHSGKLRTNRHSYELADDLEKVDTPALVGLAASAPYYHDGSAVTLRALLLENGSIHGMGKVSHLSEKDIDALVSYLETL